MLYYAKTYFLSATTFDFFLSHHDITVHWRTGIRFFWVKSRSMNANEYVDKSARKALKIRLYNYVLIYFFITHLSWRKAYFYTYFFLLLAGESTHWFV